MYDIRYSGEPGSQHSLERLDSFFLVHFLSVFRSACVSILLAFSEFAYLRPVTILPHHNKESLNPYAELCDTWTFVISIHARSSTRRYRSPDCDILPQTHPTHSRQPPSRYPTTIRTKGHGRNRTRQAIHPTGGRSQARFSVREGSRIWRSLFLPIDGPQAHGCRDRRTFPPLFTLPATWTRSFRNLPNAREVDRVPIGVV